MGFIWAGLTTASVMVVLMGCRVHPAVPGIYHKFLELFVIFFSGLTLLLLGAGAARL